MILLEENFESIEHVTEAVKDKNKVYLTGIMSQANTKNRNGRIYESSDLQKIANQVNDAARLNRHILGETDHPSTLEIKLANVSHKLVEAWMENDNLMFKTEVLETPSGLLLKSLINSGVQVGVSTRGAGSVNESSGRVTNYRFITLDAVATPSCQTAYPETLQEQLQLSKMGIDTPIAESVSADPMAQAYFLMEMKKFISSLSEK